MNDLNLTNGPTYIDNGDGTCRVEYPEATWAPWGGGPPVPVIVTPMQGARTWWFEVRCWLAEKVLRVPVGDSW